MLRNINISSILMFVILGGLVLYLSLSLDNKVNDQVSLVELNGNIHLPKDEYLKFAELNKLGKDEHVDITLIRDRLAKHPYVQMVDVIIEESTLIIDLKEKRFDALLSIGNEQYLISENSVSIPVLPFTQKINYPLISNPKIENPVAAMSSILSHKDVICAMKILSSIKLVNPDMYDQLSEINLRDGRDILVQFSNMDYPIIIGRGSEVRKIITFNTLWDYLNGNKVNNLINYVDLRYADHIFLGFSETIASDRG